MSIAKSVKTMLSIVIALIVSFTMIALLQDQAKAATDISKCQIALAYTRFIVDGKYHTPKVTVRTRAIM